MFNRLQVEKVAQDLGLPYVWSEENLNTIIVAEVIKYDWHSCWITDLRTNDKFHSNTSEKYKKLCEELVRGR